MRDLLVPAFLNIEQFYRRMYWTAPGATTVHTDQYTLSYSGITWLYSINHLWLHTPLTLNDVYLKLADRFFRRYSAEYSIVFTEPLMPDVADWLRGQGYVERLNTPILAIDGLPQPRRISSAQVVRAGPDQQQDLLHVMYNAFFIGPEIARCIVRPEHFSDPNTRHYLIYIDGDPVCCGTILIGGEIAGVWNVGTLRAYRRQGLASALLMTALGEAARDGYPASVLMASSMGRPLYEEMGYTWTAQTVYYGKRHGP